MDICDTHTYVLPCYTYIHTYVPSWFWFFGLHRWAEPTSVVLSWRNPGFFFLGVRGERSMDKGPLMTMASSSVLCVMEIQVSAASVFLCYPPWELSRCFCNGTPTVH